MVEDDSNHLGMFCFYYLDDRSIATLPDFATKFCTQVGSKSEASGELLNDSVENDFHFLIRNLEAIAVAKKKEKEDFISFRLQLPASVRGGADAFQSKHAMSFRRNALTPELMLVHRDIQTDFSRAQAFPVIKIGVGLILTVGASKKSNSVFMKDIEDVEEDEMLARTFGDLMTDGGYEKDAITFQPPRSMSQKSS
jgi:hypothetical protein